MNWQPLNRRDQLSAIDIESVGKKVLIFKHSTRCSISRAALERLQRNWKEELAQQMSCYYLDLLQYRELSNCIAEKYEVQHQSPQALIIMNGKCVFSQTHLDIELKQLAVV